MEFSWFFVSVSNCVIYCGAHCVIYCGAYCIIYCGAHCVIYCGAHCVIYCGAHCIIYCGAHCKKIESLCCWTMLKKWVSYAVVSSRLAYSSDVEKPLQLKLSKETVISSNKKSPLNKHQSRLYVGGMLSSGANKCLVLNRNFYCVCVQLCNLLWCTL